METQKASSAEIKALYRAASAFRKAAPWEWMDDDELIGVQDPVTGKTGYCCVLGAMGEVFALLVYMGEEGLDMHLKLQNNEIAQDDPDLMFMQDCLIASFENKGYLDKEDIQIIKRLNLSFRGRNAWPMFRRHKPGYFPWHPDRNEALFLTAALEQSMEVCQMLLENDQIESPDDEGLVLVRVPVTEEGKTVWKDEWRKPGRPAEDTTLNTVPLDELRIQRIKKSAKENKMSWEIDFFYSPTPISEKGERPYFPYTIMIADHDTGFIFDVYLTEKSGCEKVFMEHFLSAMENLGAIPAEILVRKKEAAALFGPCAASLQIGMKTVKKLDAIDEARSSFEEHLGSR